MKALKISVVIVLCIACCTALAACVKTDINSVSFSVSGDVIFDGKPLENVEILVNNASASTKVLSDSEGFFIVNELKKGDILSFRLEGYEFQSYTVKDRDTEGLLVVAKRIEYDVVVSCDADGGTVTGSGSYEHGASATLSATANPMYLFGGFYDGEEKLSEENEYTFTVCNSRTITALFTPIEYALAVDGVPEGVSVLGGGNYIKGDTVRLSANDTNNYVFAKWIVNNLDFSDKICEFEYSVANTTVSAVFLPRLNSVDIDCSEGVVAWSPVDNAVSYEVYLNEDFWFDTTDTYFSVFDKLYELPEGVVGIVAKDNVGYGNSLRSDITVSCYRPIDAPLSVGILNLDDGVYLSFSTVNTAVGYSISVNDTAYPLSYFSHEITTNEIKVKVDKVFDAGGSYVFRIVALAENPKKNSAPTAAVSYAYTPALSAPSAQINEGVLSWSHENSAVTFYAVIDGVRIPLNNLTSYDLTALPNGAHSVRVEARLNGYSDSFVELIYNK